MHALCGFSTLGTARDDTVITVIHTVSMYCYVESCVKQGSVARSTTHLSHTVSLCFGQDLTYQKLHIWTLSIAFFCTTA